jgi:NADPH:quinone reductase-like Zn-dependent oxidoreductase
MSQLILASIGDVDESVRLDEHPDLTLGPDDVLVAMEAATLNDTDFRFAAGRYAVKPQLPSVMGTDWTGLPAAVSAHDLIFRELQVRGFWLINWLRRAPRAEIERTYADLAGLLERGIVHAAVAGTYPLAEYRAAFAQARSAARDGKVLFTFPADAAAPGRTA